MKKINLVKISIKEVPFGSQSYFEAIPRDVIAWVTDDITNDTVKEASFEKKEYPMERIGFKIGNDVETATYYILKEDKDRLLDLLNGFLELQKKHKDLGIINDFLAWLAFTSIVSLPTIVKLKESIRYFEAEYKPSPKESSL